MSNLELLHPQHCPAEPIRAAVCDFDGTFSTLRCGWEQVMAPLMEEMIAGGGQPDETIHRRVAAYIDDSTGVQTIFQMRWLAEQVKQAGHATPERDAWWYKEEYNRRLMQRVRLRLQRLENGLDKPERYLIRGSISFLRTLRENGVELYLASGTDHRDVVREAKALGIDTWFTQIQDAPERLISSPKEAAVRSLLEGKGFSSRSLLVVGDGKVEISLGVDCGAYTLGIASDEQRLHGVNETKRARLVKAGADAIAGDFENLPELLSWLGFRAC